VTAKLRVALVALYPAPGGKAPGGVRAVVQNLVAGLRAYDDLQILVVHCHSDIEESAVVQDDSTVVHFIAMPRRRLLPNTLASIVRVERLLRQLQPDVVNTHAAHYTVAALRTGYPTVYTIHGVTHREAEVYQATLFDRLRFSLEAACARYALQHVEDVVAISPYVLEEYQGRTRARFHRIDNPLPDDFFTIPNLEEEGRLLYAGTIDERKNVLGLLRALAVVRRQIVDVRLRIAGRWINKDYYQKVRGSVVAEDLQSNVEFLGLQSTAQMLQEYAHCAAVVLASRQETAPMALIEAMAAGKPVVATRVGGVPGLVEDGQSGFVVEPDDVEAFAQRLVDLLTDRKLRCKMGQRARQLAERFRVQTVAEQYRQLYYGLAGKRML
jgi:glycosyltransferase involved in cell wall biosynthesis